MRLRNLPSSIALRWVVFALHASWRMRIQGSVRGSLACSMCDFMAEPKTMKPHVALISDLTSLFLPSARSTAPGEAPSIASSMKSSQGPTHHLARNLDTKFA